MEVRVREVLDVGVGRLSWRLMKGGMITTKRMKTGEEKKI